MSRFRKFEETEMKYIEDKMYMDVMLLITGG